MITPLRMEPFEALPEPLHLAQLPHQGGELGAVPLPLQGVERGRGGRRAAPVVPALLAPAAHPAVTALPAPTASAPAPAHPYWRGRVGKVHPPGPQPGALDAAGGGGGVVQDGAAAGQAPVLRHAQLYPAPVPECAHLYSVPECTHL